MSNTLSRKQIQQMRRLSNARFPMLGVVVVAALFVVRVPIIQSWESHADARNLQQLKNTKVSHDLDTPEADQVAASDVQTDSDSEDVEANALAAMEKVEQANEKQFSTNNWFDLLSQFQPPEQNGDFPQNDEAQDPSTADTPVDLDDLDLRHVSQLEPDDSEPSDPDTETDERVLRLHNPAENGGIVYFVVDEKTYSIKAGKTLELSGKDQWTVRFHRGGDFGNSRNTLKPGSYSFAVSRKGWKLETND